MSLIVTQVTAFGIVHVVDSNITKSEVDAVTGAEVDRLAREDSKVFPVSHLSAGLSVAGSYTAGGKPMNEWMPEFIRSTEGRDGLTLRGFAEELARWLVCTLSPEEKKKYCLVHLAGHVVDSIGYHPEFWYVRNYEGMDERTGDYPPPSERFWVSEDFWHRDALLPGQWNAVLSGRDYRYYVNGPLGARQAYNLLGPHIEGLLDILWRQPGHQLRRPETVEESRLFARAYHDLIAAAYVSSRYAAPYVGGETRVLTLPRPVGLTPHPLPSRPFPFGPRAFD